MLKHNYKLKKVLIFMLSIMLVLGTVTVPAKAASYSLTPDPLEYEDGNIILSKQGERIAADEWKVTVKGTIKEEPVEPPKMEVVFVLDASGSMYGCTDEVLHNMGTHFNHSNCPPICGNYEHAHDSSCYLCGLKIQVHAGMSECYYMDDTGVVHYQTRFDLAKEVINDMISELPEGTHIARISFNDSGNAKYHGVDEDNPDADPYDSINPGGSTYMMDGVRLALNHEECFTDDPTTQKIMIIVTDGLPSYKDKNGNDSNDLSVLTDEEIDALYGVDDAQFNEFKENGGIVYTVGFNHSDENLSKMVANGGTYNRAADGAELEKTFDQITAELTAMLIDPMGPAVDFEVTSIDQPSSSVDGEITFEDGSDTIYWNPSGNDDIANSTIEYSYTVKLNDSADMSAGVHENVPLNKTTYMKYGLGTDDENMKSAEFPIPHATYAVSTMQVNWKCGDLDIQAPTGTEAVICDFGNPEFETDYETITPEITYDGKTYYYEKTVITKNGNTVDSVNIADAAEFVVTHQYSDEKTYQVDYSYTGTVPEGAPSADANDVTGVKAGESVQIADEPSLDGYVFSGWTVAEGDVTVENGAFNMPAGNVKLQGSWTKLNGYKVLVNYYTRVNGGSYVKDNAEPVEFVAETIVTDESIDVDFNAALTWNDNVYADPALADGSAAATIEGSVLKNITPADPTAVVTLNLYRDVKTQGTAVVHYVDGEGNKLRADTVSGSIYVGDSYDVSEAEDVETIEVDGVIYDFVSDTDAAYAGQMPENGVEITRVYAERGKSVAVVHFVDEEGNTLKADEVSGSIYIGDDYDVSEAEDVETIEVDGVIYDFVSDTDAAYTGQMPENGVEITRVYAERAKATAVVKYVDENGKVLKAETSSGSIYVGSSYDLSAAEGVATITKDGVTYQFKSDNGAAYKGEMPADGVTIVRTYKVKPAPGSDDFNGGIPGDGAEIAPGTVPEDEGDGNVGANGDDTDANTPEGDPAVEPETDDTVKTGDNGPGVWPFIGLILSALAIVSCSRRFRKSN